MEDGSEPIPLQLTEQEEAMLAGEVGSAKAMAMRVIVRLAEMQEAPRLLPISRAHVDSCLYHGQASLDFAERMAQAGGRVSVPTTLNVSSLDLVHTDRVKGDDHTRKAARALMDAYTSMGAEPTWTCAPYQLPSRPGPGEHVAWAESNAIVFANSVLGARTDRYGDFVDICAAITGRVPDAGLHRDDQRRAGVVFDVSGLTEAQLGSPVIYPVLGHLVGGKAGTALPAIVGLPAATTEGELKALGAAAASSGGIGMFHAVGITPEAPDLLTATGGLEPAVVHRLTPEEIRQARRELSTFHDGSLDAVSVGTPHFSVDEIARLAGAFEGREVHGAVEFYVNTHRYTLGLAAERGLVEACERAGVKFVVDTCTYITPILSPAARRVMTDSAKWAYYAPGNLDVEVAFGSLEECVESAVAGRVALDDRVW
jgi:predicted aconitase